MTIRHYAIVLATLAVALPLFAMLFFLIPVLLPLALVAPFVIAFCIREARKPDRPAAIVAQPVARIISIAPELQHRSEILPIEHSHAA